MGSIDGASDEQPVHTVTIIKGFWIGTTVVTQKQYQAVMKMNPSYYQQSGPNAPVEKVSWNDVQKFTNRLNAKAGSTIYRLPTEAEWEYACRAGTTENRYGELDDIAWYRCGVDQGPTHVVGLKSPNAWGLYDMYGNVGQWCQDWYEKNYYVDSPPNDPNGANNAQYKVVRGIPFFYNVVLCRSASRNWFSPDLRLNYIGFRVVMIPQVQ
jgi:formylglycine-generating enzyme required for sulfatase activity